MNSSFFGTVNFKIVNYEHELVNFKLCKLNFELVLVKYELAHYWATLTLITAPNELAVTVCD